MKLLEKNWVVYDDGICCRCHNGLMTTGSIGDFNYDKNPLFEGHTGVINRIPNKWVLSWEPDTLWIHGSDGMHEHLRHDKVGMGPRSDITIPLYTNLLTRASKQNWSCNVGKKC